MATSGPSSSTLSQLSAIPGGRDRAHTRAPASDSSSASEIKTPTGSAGDSDAAASSTTATPLALSSAPALRAPTIDSMSGTPPTHATTSAGASRLDFASSARPTPISPAVITTTPATRMSIGTGCDLESRCATSQSRVGDGPRVASRLTPARRITGASATLRARPIATAMATPIAPIIHHVAEPASCVRADDGQRRGEREQQPERRSTESSRERRILE